MTQTIVVLVPGITGTSLVRGALNVWPYEVLLDRKDAVSLLSQPDIEAAGPILNLIKPGVRPTTIPVYSGLVSYFQDQGYTYVTQNQSLSGITGNVLVGFGYDWRQPNRVSAQALNSLLAAVAGTFGAGAQIWLIGHSMGGLVSRYVLESGMDTSAWRPQLQGLITLGTPHLGAPLALSAITGQANVSDLLNPEIIEEVVDMPQFPSPFELLPPPEATFVSDASGTSYSIYSGPVNALLTASPTAVPPGFGAPTSSFEDAAAFFGGLDYGSAQGARPPYYVVYGSSAPDPTIVSFTYVAASPPPPSQQLVQAPDTYGDRVVPEWSASFGLVQPENTGYPAGWVSGQPYNAAGVTHGQLPGNPGVLHQIATWMGLVPQQREVAEVQPVVAAAV